MEVTVRTASGPGTAPTPGAARARRVAVALGGNALLRRGEAMTSENQRVNVAVACAQLAKIAAGVDLIVSHGNGPQIGLLALEGPHTSRYLRTLSMCWVRRRRAWSAT